MNHNDCQEALFDLDGPEPMDLSRRQLVLAHLDSCDECRAVQARWAQVSATFLSGLPMFRPAHASETLVQQVLARLPDLYGRTQDLQWPLFTRWALPLLGAAAAALVLAVKMPSSADQETTNPFSLASVSVSSVDTGPASQSTFLSEESDS